MASSSIYSTLQPKDASRKLTTTQIGQIRSEVEKAIAVFSLHSSYTEVEDFLDIWDSKNGYSALLDSIRPSGRSNQIVYMRDAARFVAHFIDELGGEESGEIRTAFANTIIRARACNGGNRKSDTWGKSAVEILRGRQTTGVSLQDGLRDLVLQCKADGLSKAEISAKVDAFRASFE